MPPIPEHHIDRVLWVSEGADIAGQRRGAPCYGLHDALGRCGGRRFGSFSGFEAGIINVRFCF